MSPRDERIPNLALQAHRERLDLKQQDVAEGLAELAWTLERMRVGVNADMVSKWERGEKQPSRLYRKLLSILFGTTQEELGLRGSRNEGRTEPSPAFVLTGDGMNRRELLRSTAVVGAAALTMPTGIPRRLDPEVVGCLAGLLREYARADNLLGPQHLIATVTLHLGYIGELLTIASGPVRSSLLVVGARYSEFAGWLHQDAGNPQAGEYWSDHALAWARAANDPLRTSYVLMRKSNQASGLGRSDQTLALAHAALRWHGSPAPRTRALALRQVAHGHALAGSASACGRALDDAREQVALGQEHDEDHDMAAYCTPEYVEMEAAGCWMTLGDAGKAIAIFQRALATWPTEYLRDKGVQLARLANAHAANREPEQACAVAQQALEIAADTGSGRALAALTRLSLRLERWQELREVRDLREALATVS